MSNTKIIRINDYVSVYYRGSTINCPISRMTVTEYDLGMIMNRHDVRPPKHIYAICPKDKNVLVPLTKENFRLTNEELFPEHYSTETTVVIEEEKPKFEKKSFNEMVKESAPVKGYVAVETPAVVEEVTVTEAAEEPETDNAQTEDVKVEEITTETPVEETTEEVVEESKDDEEVIVVAGASDEDTDEEDVIEVVNTTVEETNVETAATKTNNNSYNKNKKKKRK